MLLHVQRRSVSKLCKSGEWCRNGGWSCGAPVASVLHGANFNALNILARPFAFAGGLAGEREAGKGMVLAIVNAPRAFWLRLALYWFGFG